MGRQADPRAGARGRPCKPGGPKLDQRLPGPAAGAPPAARGAAAASNSGRWRQHPMGAAGSVSLRGSRGAGIRHVGLRRRAGKSGPRLAALERRLPRPAGCLIP